VTTTPNNAEVTDEQVRAAFLCKLTELSRGLENEPIHLPRVERCLPGTEDQIDKALMGLYEDGYIDMMMIKGKSYVFLGDEDDLRIATIRKAAGKLRVPRILI